MRVMVTGGTGFVGAHSVKAALDAGHDVRLLVRDPSRVERNVRSLGALVTDHVIGDMCDPRSVDRALDGCDAVLHCAAMVVLERKRAAEVVEKNLVGAQTVLGRAVERGLDPVVHVSSAAALFKPGVSLFTADLPPVEVHDAYGRSKAEVENYARSLQDRGAPVTITYPGGIVGPPAGDAFGQVAEGLVQAMKMPLFAADGVLPVIDVRDVARIHAALFESGRGPRRYMCGGFALGMREAARVYEELTGRKFRVLPGLGRVLRGVGRAVDVIHHVVEFDTVFTGEQMTMHTRWPRSDDSAIREELGITLRDPRETLRDALRGLYEAGRLDRHHVGRLAD